MIKYIYESATKAQNNRNEYELFGRITVQIANPLPNQVSVKSVLKKIESDLPEHIVYDVDSIYVGDFKPLNDRQVDSLYISGSILISNNQKSEKTLFDTIIHEFAHAVEEIASSFIYSDGEIQNEFLHKRLYLYNILKDDYKLNKKAFISTKFSQEFDDFLNKEIGYDNLGIITSNLFLSPYGATNLREYFANGFEHYYRSNPQEVKRLSPQVYKKIVGILNGDYL